MCNFGVRGKYIKIHDLLVMELTSYLSKCNKIKFLLEFRCESSVFLMKILYIIQKYCSI